MFQKNHPKVGARPGTLVIPSDSPSPQLRVMRYSNTAFEEATVDSADEVAQMLGEGEANLWIDVEGLGDEALLWQLAELLDIHPLTLEDAVNAPQRPKAELHEVHLLVIARTPDAGDIAKLDFPQVCVIIGTRHVVTFQEQRRGLLDPVRERARSPHGRIRSSGVDYLGYAIIDALVDRFYPVVEELGQRIDDLEDHIMDQPVGGDLIEIQRLRRFIVSLRRITWAQREMVRDLLREDTVFISDEVQIFLRDTRDHMAQVADVADSSRDIISSLLEVYLSIVGERTNEVMKVLTIMSTIFIPLTFLAGIYGMNFEHMPELRRPWAYPILLATMAVIAIALFGYFRHLGWFGTPALRKRGRGRSSQVPPPTG